jgi:hypothetical protein
MGRGRLGDSFYLEGLCLTNGDVSLLLLLTITTTTIYIQINKGGDIYMIGSKAIGGKCEMGGF